MFCSPPAEADCDWESYSVSVPDVHAARCVLIAPALFAFSHLLRCRPSLVKLGPAVPLNVLDAFQQALILCVDFTRCMHMCVYAYVVKAGDLRKKKKSGVGGHFISRNR